MELTAVRTADDLRREASAEAGQKITWMTTASLRPDPDNPRGRVTEDEALRELADSIRAQGILQPLVIGKDGTILAGHRRYAAAKLAGMRRVPTIIREASPPERLLLMLVENLQRKDLDPLRVANAYTQLRTMGLTDVEIGRQVGKTDGHVWQMRQLVRLPDDVRAQIGKGDLSATQGVALSRFVDRPDVLRRVAADAARYGLSAKAIAALDSQGERPTPVAVPSLPAVPAPTIAVPTTHGVAVERNSFAGGEFPSGKAPRNRQPQITMAAIDPRDFTGEWSAEDVRLAERSNIAEWMRARAPDQPTKELRGAFFDLAARIDRGEHATEETR